MSCLQNLGRIEEHLLNFAQIWHIAEFLILDEYWYYVSFQLFFFGDPTFLTTRTTKNFRMVATKVQI